MGKKKSKTKQEARPLYWTHDCKRLGLFGLFSPIFVSTRSIEDGDCPRCGAASAGYPKHSDPSPSTGYEDDWYDYMDGR